MGRQLILITVHNLSKDKEGRKDMKKVTGKRLLTAALLLGFTIVLAGCSGKKEERPASASGPAETVKIRVGCQSEFQGYVAYEKGFFDEVFKDDNVEVELSFFTLGPPMIEALTSGDLDFGFMGDQPAFSGLANGLNIKIIGSYKTSDTAYGLVAAADSGITKLEDLKGKKVAVPFGSNIQLLEELYLQKAGLTNDDIELINLSFANIVTSLDSGEIDAAVSAEPYITQSLNKGNSVQIADAQGIKLFVNPIVVRSEFAETYPDITAKYLKALQMATDWIADNQEEAIKIVAERTEATEESLKAVITKTDFSIALPEDKIAAIVTAAEQSYDAGLITKDIGIKDHIDTTYLKEAGIQ